jgi:hypothetical protein
VDVERLWMVYDADGGLRGELAYVIGTLRGAHCGLCDITHGRLRRKSAWDDFVCTLSVPVEVVHRNEQPPALAAFTRDRTPCVVAEAAAGYEVLLDGSALGDCAGDVDRFADALAVALTPA